MTTIQIPSGLEDDDAFRPVSGIEAPKTTAMTSLRAELAKKVVNVPVTRVVPGRPNVSLRFDTNIDADLLRAWQNRTTRKVRGKSEPEQDVLRFATIVIAAQCESVLFAGEDQTDESGSPINFRNPELASMLGVDSTNTHAVVRALYGNDGHILTLSQDVLRAAGYDMDIDFQEDEDPTKKS